MLLLGNTQESFYLNYLGLVKVRCKTLRVLEKQTGAYVPQNTRNAMAANDSARRSPHSHFLPLWEVVTYKKKLQRTLCCLRFCFFRILPLVSSHVRELVWEKEKPFW